MREFRFQLERGSKKHFCPGCEKRRFVRFQDMKTGNYLPPEYGRCDRENGCGYFCDPYTTGYAKKIFRNEKGSFTSFTPTYTKPKQKPKPNPIFIPKEVLKETLTGYDQNIFLKNLTANVPYPFEAPDIEKLIGHYWLGTITGNYMKGSITLPYIDEAGNITAVQALEYDHSNKKKKEGWLHTILKYEQGDHPTGWLKQYEDQDKRIRCLFGAHLLKKYPNNPVAIVEGPKTALYAALYYGFPTNDQDRIWLATFNVSTFKYDYLKALKGRFVYVYPDLSKDGRTFASWQAKAAEFERMVPGSRFVVSDFLERIATDKERQEGDDIADYLIKSDWREFRRVEKPDKPNRNFTPKELIQWFSQWALPDHPIKIDFDLPVRFGEPSPGSELVKHLNTILKGDRSTDEYKGAYLTLVQLKEKIEQGKSPLKKRELNINS